MDPISNYTIPASVSICYGDVCFFQSRLFYTYKISLTRNLRVEYKLDSPYRECCGTVTALFPLLDYIASMIW
jgi:hypothetical protein